MNKQIIASSQPIPVSLKDSLPVNYFLLVKNTIQKEDLVPLLVRSELHQTNSYMVISFYKPISNIL